MLDADLLDGRGNAPASGQCFVEALPYTTETKDANVQMFPSHFDQGFRRWPFVSKIQRLCPGRGSNLHGILFRN